MKLVSLVAFVAVVGSGFASASSVTRSRAWTITSSKATQSEDVLGKHQEFVKVWTVTGSSPVDAIQLAAAGLVFIDYDANMNGASTSAPTTEAPVTEAPVTEAPTEAPATHAPTTEPPTEAPVTTEPPSSGSGGVSPVDAVVSLAGAGEVKSVAKVVFSGNCTQLLDEFEVVERSGAISVHFKNEDFKGFGYILTQITVGEKAAVASVSSTGSSSVYVGEDVLLATSGTPRIAISGDADVFVTAPNTDFSVKSLDLKVTGSGNVQFNAGSLVINDSLSSKVSGDGDIAVVAKSINVSDSIDTKISGEGNVYVQAGSVTTFKLNSKISGDGDITISTNGSCVAQDISISGSGNVATGSILCEDTKLRLSGEGDVLVQTSGTFKVPYEIIGKVQYVGTAPQTITDGRPPQPPRPKPMCPPPKPHGWRWGWWDDGCDDDSDDDSEDDDDRHLPNSVTAATENKYKTYELREVPAREATFLVLTMNHNRWGSDPSEHVVISILGYDIDIGGGSLVVGTQQLAAQVHETHGALGTAALGVFVVAAVAAVGVAVHKVAMQRRRRREYQPLLEVVSR